MQSEGQITAIIPTYRRPQLLKRAIESALNQTYPHMRVCVYDNASGDNTEQVVAEIAKKDPRVSYYCHSENIGAVNNFIFGMKQVETPFISFLSDDDVLLPDFFESMYKELLKYPDAIFSAGSTIIMTEAGKVLDVSLLSWPREGYYSPPDGMFEMVEKNSTWTSILFRKEVIYEVGLLDDNIIGIADYDFQLRVAIRFPIIILKKPCAIFLNHHSSLSVQANLDHLWPGWKFLNNNIYADERIPIEVREHAVDLLSGYFKNALIHTAIQSLHRENYKDIVKISEVVHQYLKLPGTAFIIKLIVQFCRIPGFGPLIRMADHLRRKLGKTSLKNSQLNRDYGHYAKWL